MRRFTFKLARSAPMPLAFSFVLLATGACKGSSSTHAPELAWYVPTEPSGAFAEATRRCTAAARGAYSLRMVPLPSDADEQRVQLARRLAAGDRSIDLIGMDVIWTAEFARAGWIVPWRGEVAQRLRRGRFPAAVRSASYRGVLWAIPFTTNAQLLWYRKDRIAQAPATWDAMIDAAQALDAGGWIEAQGERYEGLTVLFVSLLASAGGEVLDRQERVALPEGPLRRALAVMRRLGRSPAADPALSTAREDQGRLAFEAGKAAVMVNYPFVWPSAWRDAPPIARQLAWSRWPAVVEGQPSRVTLGGYHLAVSATSRYRSLARRAAICLTSAEHQRLAAARGGLPPTIASLYDDPTVRQTFPFADTLRRTLADAVQRPRTPLYTDLSLAISRTLHPMRDIVVDRDARRLRRAVERAIDGEGLY